MSPNRAEGIATNVLSERLARLERVGMVSRTRDRDDARRVVYALTPRGRSLETVLQAVAMWGIEHLRGTRLAPELAQAASSRRRT